MLLKVRGGWEGGHLHFPFSSGYSTEIFEFFSSMFSFLVCCFV